MCYHARPEGQVETETRRNKVTSRDSSRCRISLLREGLLCISISDYSRNFEKKIEDGVNIVLGSQILVCPVCVL